MNIVIVTESHSLGSGGLSRSLRAQVDEFRRRGHRALIAVPHDPKSSIQIHEPDVIEIPASNSPEASGFGAASQWFSANSPVLDEFRPDVVHAHAPFVAGALAVRIASRYSAPLVFTIHRHSGLDTPRIQMPRTLTRRFSEELAGGYCRLADVVIAPNGPLAAFVLDHGVESRVEIVPTGVDVDRLSRGSRSRLRQHHRVPDNAFTVGQSGSFDRECDRSASLRFIRRFLHQHDDAHWFIVCGADLSGSGVEQLRMSESLSARLHVIAAATPGDFADFYASLDVFVDAAIREEEPIELVEALAAGTLVIASWTPTNRQLLGGEHCGRLLNSASHRELNAAIESLQRVAADTSRQVREVAHRAVAPYRIDSCCERLLALYAQAIESAVKRDRPTIGDWHTLAQRLSTERRLWRTRGRAIGAALTRRRDASRVPVLRYAIAGWRVFRHWTSRRAWSVRLLNLPVWETNAEEPGLIVLQVDGLSRAHLESALNGPGGQHHAAD